MEINELAAAIALVEDEKSVKLDKAKLLLDLSANIKQVFDSLVKVKWRTMKSALPTNLGR